MSGRGEGRDDDARFEGEKIDADERVSHPGVDDDSLVEHAIEYLDEACAAWRAFNRQTTGRCDTA